MREFFFLAWLLVCTCVAPGQVPLQIKGNVSDVNGRPLELVTITLKDSTRIVAFARTDKGGAYTLSPSTGDIRGLSIEASAIGYKKVAAQVTVLNKPYNFTLETEAVLLETVVVKDRPALSVRGDTLSYRTADFAGAADRSIGDVLKKMPGIEVAENGKISYNGKPISNLYIDGDNLLDDKYNIAGKSIPQQAVEDVQVISNDQPVKMMRQNNMSEDVALNLVIKDEARLRMMGEATVGAGTPEKFDGNLSAMMFNKKLKFINNVKGNNIGNDPAIELTAHNQSDYLTRLERKTTDCLLSTGAVDVPALPRNRSLFNKAGLMNLNNLYKINGDMQLKANIAWLYDDRRQQYSRLSETYLSGETIRYTERQNNRLYPQKILARFNLNDNAERHYLNNSFIISYEPMRAVSGIVMNDQSAVQSLRQESLEISNEFNQRKKLRSDDILNWYSYISRTSQPERLTITPGLNEDIFNGGVPYDAISQRVRQPSWFTHNYLSFAAVTGNFVQTYKGGFSVQHHKLSSALRKMQAGQEEGIPALSGAVNDLDWLKTKFYAEVLYEFSGDKIKAGFGIPVSYNAIDYSDPFYASDGNMQKIFVNPSVNMRYRVGVENELSASYVFRNELGGAEDVYRGTILKNYRSLFANDAPVSETSLHTMNAAFNFRKAMQMLFFNAAVGYSYASVNTVSSYILSNNIQQRVVLPLPNHIKSLNASANASKYIFSLKSTVSGGINFNRNTFEQLQNNELLPFVAMNTAFNTAVEARLTKFANWSYDVVYSLTNSRARAGAGVGNRFEQLRQESALSLAVLKNTLWNVSVQQLFIRRSQQRDVNYFFADISLKYKLSKIKTDIEACITNLANIKAFDAVTLSANTVTSGTYTIPGRVAMLKAMFNF